MKLIKKIRRAVRETTVNAIEKFEDFKDRRAVAKFQDENPLVDLRLVPEDEYPAGHDADGKLSLFKEKLDGRNAREDAGLAPVLEPAPPYETPRPVFRKDGQIHNFAAAGSHAITGRNRNKGRFSVAQYDARYAGHRPVPRNVVPPPGSVPER